MGRAGDELQLGYHGKRVVDGASLRIEAASVTALVGPNGSGKSTLLRALARLHHPDGGFLRTGDVVNWINGRSGRAITYVLDQRFPRVLSAVLCGAALAIAGTTVQAVCRNPLAEPGILGITGGAGVGAIASSTSTGSTCPHWRS